MLVNANAQRLKRQQEETEYCKKQNELKAIQIQQEHELEIKKMKIEFEN